MSSDVREERAARSSETSRTIVSIGVANVALYVVYMGVLQLLLPHQLGLIDPANKVSLFGAITGVAALAATVANPLAGALSDRTRSPWGRRTPWIVAIAFIAPAALVLLGAMNTILGVIIGWCLVQIVMNCFQAPFAAILPERVPERSRGIASAALGVGVPLGIIIGTVIGKRYLDTLPLAYGALGLVFLLTALGFVALNPEPRGPVEQAPKPQGRLRDFFSALADRDFLWAFVSRFLIQLNYCATTTFHLFLLQDYVRLDPGQTAEQALVLVNVAGMASMTIATVVSGWASDLARRRKVFVSTSALLLCGSALIPIFSPTFEGMLAFAIANGIGMGCYLAVDIAVAAQVLPNAETRARDLGVFNIAAAGPQVMGPFVASLFVAHLGGYPAMLVYGAAMAAISGFTILNVRKVS